ncbi:MAG: hypothetical protein WCY86_14095, partial [Spirosomataceae bacterium]
MKLLRSSIVLFALFLIGTTFSIAQGPPGGGGGRMGGRPGGGGGFESGRQQRPQQGIPGTLE